MFDRTPGWTLPQRAYTDTRVFDADLEHVFGSGWLFAGHVCELHEPGHYLAMTVGRDRVLVVRGTNGALHAHHDTCAHRGSRMVGADHGQVKAFVCPYHRWVYDLDGRLRAARLMGECFLTSSYRLAPVAIRELAGLVFVCVAAEPPDFTAFAAAAGPALEPHGLAVARVVAREHYRVRANWKTLVENNRECYHCRGSHPEFCMANYDHGVNGDARPDPRYASAVAAAQSRWASAGLPTEEVSFPGGSWFRVARLPLRDGFVTETPDGRPAAPLMGSLPDTDVGSLRVIGLPNMWAHANCDYAVTTRLTPVDAGTTDVDLTFLVRGDAPDDTVDVDALTSIWRITSEQDWELCENNYAGIASRGYRPGPFSPVVETSVETFVRWYETALRSAAAAQNHR